MNMNRRLAKFLAEKTRLATSDPGIADAIADRLIEDGWVRIDDINDLIAVMKRLEMRRELAGMGRSHWAEARHIIRYVREDLSALHTEIEVVSEGWEAAVVIELSGAIGRLQALINYITRAQLRRATTEVLLPEVGSKDGEDTETRDEVKEA